MIRHRRLRTLIAALALVLPARARRAVHVRLLGHEIDPSARIGRAFVDVEHLVMGPGAQIAGLTVVRGCQNVVLGERASIGPLNLVNGVARHKPTFSALDRHPALIMGDHANITAMHFLDCSDRVELADLAVLAGVWSVVLTHSFDHRASRQSTTPVRIGVRTIVATRCTLLPGAVIGDHCIVGACSTITGKLDGDSVLWGGTPARSLRELDPESAFFQRTENMLR